MMSAPWTGTTMSPAKSRLAAESAPTPAAPLIEREPPVMAPAASRLPPVRAPVAERSAQATVPVAVTPSHVSWPQSMSPLSAVAIAAIRCTASFCLRAPGDACAQFNLLHARLLLALAWPFLPSSSVCCFAKFLEHCARCSSRVVPRSPF